MKSLKIDKDGNFVKINDSWILTSTLTEHVAQKLQIRLKKFSAEYYLDSVTDNGIPFFKNMDKNINVNIVDAMFKNEIMKEDGVIGILQFQSVYNNATREYSFKFTAQLSNNTVVKSGVTI